MSGGLEGYNWVSSSNYVCTAYGAQFSASDTTGQCRDCATGHFPKPDRSGCEQCPSGYSLADNTKTSADAACTQNGCTDSSACNYNGDALGDDGSCEYAENNYDCDGVCLNDADGDEVCDELEIQGCQVQHNTVNYNPAATDAGSCTCATGYAGDNCDECAAKFTGAGANCDECITGYAGDECDQCAAGYGGSGNTCTVCGIGTYSSTNGTSACTSCGAGKTTATEGSTASTACVDQM